MESADFDLLKPWIISEKLERNQVLNEPGSEVDTVHFPAGAIISIITMMEDGRGVESCNIGHENAYGLASALGSTRSVDLVIAQVPGASYRLPTPRLRAVAEQSPPLTDLMIRHVQSTLAQTAQSAACNALHPVEARLCRWLLASADRSQNELLPLTQEFLGFMLGVQRTSVTLAARSLQAAGLIRYRRGQIEIIDHKGLEDGACECYAAARLKHEQFFDNRPRPR